MKNVINLPFRIFFIIDENILKIIIFLDDLINFTYFYNL